jgi:CRP/FNR family transcriptional regulator, dissimilatory nitrate respiration regulator
VKSIKEKVLHLLNTEGKNETFKVTTDLESIAGELGVTHEALYRALTSLGNENLIRREEGLLLRTQ